MGCNCGDNEYNITVDNNGNCEPTTPVYNITLANVGVNGYSPIVRFVNETIDSFNIAVDNVTGTDTSPAVPKLSYVSDQINNINTTIANLGNTYLTVNGSNAANPITFNHLTMGYQYGSPYINSDGNLYIRGAVLSLQATGDINLSTTGTSKAYYNNNEIATVNNLDTYLKTDGSNINRDFSITNYSFTINNTTIDDMGRIIGNTGGALYLRDAGGNTSLSVNSQGVSILNNIGQSFTINNKQIATVDQIPTVGNGTITINQGGTQKGTFTLNQSGNTTINLDAGGSGAVDSVNGQTGTVVLTASDVGALPSSTVIPTKTSDLTNDSGYITNSALSGYATQTWVGNQGYITGITSSDVTTALGYTPYDSTNPDGFITSADLPTNYVTTDTAQTITGLKTFNSIKTDTVYNTNNNPILQIYSSTIRVGNSNYGLKLLGDSTRPEYSMDSGTSYNQLALLSDIPTVNDSTITFTQDGVTKGTFTTNQSGNATIELDSGVTNPLTITDEGSNNFLEFIVNSSGSYIRTGTQGLAFNGYLITTVDNPLSLDNVAFGLKAIALKYDNDTIKVNQDGQLYADVQGGGGSYTAGTGIDITSNVISVDNTVAMKTDIPTNNNQLTNGAGYITASALNNYVTNSTLTTTLADYQPTLVSGTNIKTVNNTSLLGSGNIDVLQNTASRNTSLTIGDNASTLSYTTNVGIGSQATATAGQAFGHYAIAGGQYSLALGQGTEASSNYAIQLGKGTNATATTLSVGFGNNGNYQLLNGTTGLIPDARISNNIARTSNVADKDLSNLSTTGQAVIDGKVSKSGDTMTGALNLDMTTVGSSNENFQDITFTLDDINRAGLRCSHSTDGTNRVQIIVRNNSGTFASGYEASNNNGTLSCSFPDTTCVDGQWQFINTVIMDNVSVTGSSNLTYTLSNVPNDGHMYEVMLTGNVETGTTSGNFCTLQLRSDFSTGAVTRICSVRTRSSSYMQAQGTVIIPLTSSRKIYVSRNTGWVGTANLWLIGYRRIGTNS